MASSQSLKKFLAPNLLTRFNTPFHLSSSRFINTNSSSHNSKVPKDDYHSEDIVKIESGPSFARDIFNVFRTAGYYLFDYIPSTPIGFLRYMLNSLDVSGPRGPRMWKVRQSAEALFISRYMPRDGEEDVKIFVVRNSSIWDNEPRNNTLAGSGNSEKLGMELIRSYLGHYRVYQYMVSQPAILVIEREGRNESKDEEDCGSYTVKLNLSGKLYNTNAIKIEKMNERLNVTVPKLEAKWINLLQFQIITKGTRGQYK